MPKNIPDFIIQIPIRVISNGRKNESTQKLLVRPVLTVLAPKTAPRVTMTEAEVVGFEPFELVTETLFVKVVVP